MQPTLAQAFELRKNKNMAQALDLYNTLWQQEPLAFGEWDLWSYGQCLRHTRAYQQALAVSRAAYTRFAQSTLLNQQYAWCIYYTQIATTPAGAGSSHTATLEKAVNAILQLSPPHTPYSPAVRSIFKTIKHLSTLPHAPWLQMEGWLNRLDVTQLTQDTYAVALPGKNKQTELASDVEEWYSWKSKCLLQQGQWEACLQLCAEAAANIKKWHYSNDVWFGRRQAACLVQLNRRAEAATLLTQLLRRKKEWFMLADLAEITADPVAALGLYAQAALAYGDPPKKLRLYASMMALLQQQNKAAEALLHAQLMVALRLQNQWPVAPELMAQAANGGAVPSVAALLQQLNPLWSTWQAGANGTKAAARQLGTVANLLPNGHAGFIKPEAGGANLYFLIKQYRGAAQSLRVGLKISYEIAEGYDNKKQQATQQAVNLRAI
ncbi:MAG: hypothetical protein EAY75_01300 [Bacteroidetes bacterium]|nr:MAG: hypothetical protein EAY75_01300 [Bacteroidota bacterium]